MSNLNFPSNPTSGQQYGVNGKTWQWTGVAWQIVRSTVVGQSAYELAIANGFVGTEAQWLSSLIGPSGSIGPTGVAGATGPKGNTGDAGPAGSNGTNGTNGTNGIGVPAGGSPGQILTKSSLTDFATSWITPNYLSNYNIPLGGNSGQFLGKNSATDGDFSWLNLPATSSSDSIPIGGNEGQVLTKNSATSGDVSWKDVPLGEGEVPQGGTIGQILTKNSSNNGDFSWLAPIKEIPTGGTNGQYLTKNGSTDGALTWTTLPATLPTGGTSGQVLTKNSSTNGDATWLTPAVPNASILVSQNGTTIDANATQLNFTGSGVIVTDASSGHVNIAISGGSGSSTLAALTDVNMTVTPTDGQKLTFDSTMSKWKPVSTSAIALDPMWSNVSLLMSAEHGFADESDYHHPMSILSSVTLDTSIKKFGTASYKFNGLGGLYTPYVNELGLTGTSTFEAWVYLENRADNQSIMGCWDNNGTLNSSSWYFWVLNGKFAIRTSNGNYTDVATNISPSIGQWYHVALSSTNGIVDIYINGVWQVQTSTGFNNSASTFSLGTIGGTDSYPGSPALDFIGHMDEIRVTYGARRYLPNTSFTVPTAPYLRGNAIRPIYVLSDLMDINTSSAPTNGQVLSYNSTNLTWVPTTVSGGSTTLASLSDVNLTTAPTNGQSLTYNSSTSKWIPATISGSSNPLSVNNGSTVVANNVTNLRFSGTGITNITNPTTGEVDIVITAGTGSSGGSSGSSSNLWSFANATSVNIVGSVTAVATADVGINGDPNTSLGVSPANGFYWNTNATSAAVVFDFGTTVVLTGIAWGQDRIADNGTWQAAGSNDNSTWTNLGIPVHVGLAVVTGIPFTNTTAYRYYRISLSSGTTSNSPFVNQFLFRFPFAASGSSSGSGSSNVITIAKTGAFTSVSEVDITGLDFVNYHYDLDLSIPTMSPGNTSIALQMGDTSSTPNWMTNTWYGSGQGNGGGGTSFNNNAINISYGGGTNCYSFTGLRYDNVTGFIIAQIQSALWELHGEGDSGLTAIPGAMRILAVNGSNLTGSYTLYKIAKNQASAAGSNGASGLYDISAGVPSQISTTEYGSSTLFSWSYNSTYGRTVKNIAQTSGSSGSGMLGGWLYPVPSGAFHVATLVTGNRGSARYYGDSIGLYNNTSDRTVNMTAFSGVYNQVEWMRWNSNGNRQNSNAANIYTNYDAGGRSGPYWLHLKCDASGNITMGISFDGANPYWMISTTVADWIGTATHISFGGYWNADQPAVGTSTSVLCFDLYGDGRKVGMPQGNSSSSSTALSGLTDVKISATPTNGQSLVWNTSDNKWEPGTVSTNSSVTTSISHDFGAIASTGGGTVYNGGIWFGNAYTVDSVGSISSVVYGLVASANGINATPAIYADSSGAPGALLATGPTIANGVTGDNVVPLTSPLTVTAGQKIWIGVFQANIGGISAAYTASSTPSVYYIASPPAASPAPGISTWNNGNIRIFGRGTASISVTGRRFKLPFFFTSTPVAYETLSIIVADEAFVIPVNFAGTQYVKTGINPTSTFVLNITQNGTIIGNISINTTGNATLTTVNGSPISISAGDILAYVAPSVVDASVANVAGMLWGYVL